MAIGSTAHVGNQNQSMQRPCTLLLSAAQIECSVTLTSALVLIIRATITDIKTSDVTETCSILHLSEARRVLALTTEPRLDATGLRLANNDNDYRRQSNGNSNENSQRSHVRRRTTHSNRGGHRGRTGRTSRTGHPTTPLRCRYKQQ